MNYVEDFIDENNKQSDEREHVPAHSTDDVHAPVDDVSESRDTATDDDVAESDEQVNESAAETDSAEEEPEDKPEDQVTQLQQRLLTSLVKEDGRLADPADLPFDATLLEDPEKLYEAITDLITRKPGLKARGVQGDVGAGERSTQGKPFDLIEFIKGL